MRSKIQTIWELMRGDRLLYLAALAGILLSAAVLYVTPLISRTAIDHIIEGKPLELPATA